MRRISLMFQNNNFEKNITKKINYSSFFLYRKYISQIFYASYFPSFLSFPSFHIFKQKFSSCIFFKILTQNKYVVYVFLKIETPTIYNTMIQSTKIQELGHLHRFSIIILILSSHKLFLCICKNIVCQMFKILNCLMV